jgi:hypothetical protein
MPPHEDSRTAVPHGRAGEAPCSELREISGHTTIATVIGEHDLFTEQSLREQLERARMASIVIVDLTRCTFLDSTIMPRPPGTVASRALRLTGVPEFFGSHAALEAALANAQAASAHV